MQVTIPEASSRLAQLIRSVQAGNEVLIAEGENPVARLLPVAPATEADEEPGRARTILDWLAHHPVPPANRRSAEEIDAAIAAERTAWD
jgi:antitoxin (DNA-binding transcriptional repressor) of toxin-antitoxin stability system